MRHNLDDIIEILKKVRNTDIFLTMVCKPHWPEIVNALLEFEKPQDRQDIIAKVFKMNLKLFLDTVTNQKGFGNVASHVCVVEFQNRGLPHVHSNFFTYEQSKGTDQSPAVVNDIISAQAPPEVNPHDRGCVLKHMIHKLCVENNRSSFCTSRMGYCTFAIPK